MTPNQHGGVAGPGVGRGISTSPAYSCATYGRKQSPFLAMSDGLAAFLHTSNDGVSDIAMRKLECAPLGILPLPSGVMCVVDPFVTMRRNGNPGVIVPGVQAQIWQTLAHFGEYREGARPRVAYLSMVFDEAAMEARRYWQRGRRLDGLDPSVPVAALECAALTPEGRPFREEEWDADDLPECLYADIQSGTIAVLDSQGVVEGMPEDCETVGDGWYEALFEHGKPGSWFDRMDGEHHYRVGAANFPLPLAGSSGEPRIVLSQSGFGDGRYPVIAERVFLNDEGRYPSDKTMGAIIAMHVDFGIVPRSPHNPPYPALPA